MGSRDKCRRHSRRDCTICKSSSDSSSSTASDLTNPVSPLWTSIYDSGSGGSSYDSGSSSCGSGGGE